MNILTAIAKVTKELIFFVRNIILIADRMVILLLCFCVVQHLMLLFYLSMSYFSFIDLICDNLCTMLLCQMFLTTPMILFASYYAISLTNAQKLTISVCNK